MKFKRASGILLHPTSLPGPYGIGDIGPEAFRWIDFLKESATGLWQVLPLGPTGYGDSPYQCFSAFAGNFYLVSPAALLADGLLHSNDLIENRNFPAELVDYGAVIPWKIEILDKAYDRFQKKASVEMRRELEQFRNEQTYWLPDFALFMALKEAHGGAPWTTWDPPLRDRDPQALESAKDEHHLAIERQVFRQFIFFRQWRVLRKHTNSLGIKIIGDVPIFVAHDSADVWAHRELFYLDEKGNPTVVAGVPPDYFSPTGQLWGNPLYRWDIHQSNGYKWWIERLSAVLQMVDIIRLDHFRGFAGYWEVPAGLPTAEKGKWVPGPGEGFFLKVRDGLGELPLIAEDLGEITPDVIVLRDKFYLPGMKILQFAFEGDKDFLPHNYPENCVAYSGTHDNDTSRGWYDSASEQDKDFARRYLGRSGEDIAWEMMRAIWISTAMFSISPMQDLLQLGTEARMNYPGRASGNWTWRMISTDLTPQLRDQLNEYNHLYERLLEIPEEPEKIPAPHA